MSSDSLRGLANGVAATKSAMSIFDQVASISNHFKPYKPEVKSLRIDYLKHESELKYLLLIPRGVGRKAHRKVELPITYGFKVYDVLDLDTAGLARIDFDQQGMKWVCSLDQFPVGERFLVTIRGSVGQDFLDRLVAINVAKDPEKLEENDRYWIHTALKDVSILERVWNDLNIDRVNAGVRVGVERYFASAIPEEIKKALSVRRKLLAAIRRGDRNIEGLKLEYRRTELAGSISPDEIYNLLLKLVSGDFFADFVKVDSPFVLGGIEPEKDFTSLIPERVKVGVLADLGYRRPAAEGSLFFQRKQYTESVSDEIGKLIPKKTKRTTKKRAEPRG